MASNQDLSELLLERWTQTFKIRRKTRRYLVYSAARHPTSSSQGHVGGLADRLKGLMTMFLLSLVTERRFAIHWDRPFPVSEILSEGQLVWQVHDVVRRPFRERGLLHIDLMDAPRVLDGLTADTIDAELFRGAERVVCNFNRFHLDIFNEWLRGHHGIETTEAEAVHTCFKLLFEFVDTPEHARNRDAFEAVKASHDAVIGVHVRTGAGNGWDDPVHDTWENGRLAVDRAIRFCAARGIARPAILFLSDSERARADVAQADWPHLVWVEDVEVSHLDRSADSDRLSHLGTIHEFRMLSRCDHIIHGHGMFARMAGYIGDVPMVDYRDLPDA